MLEFKQMSPKCIIGIIVLCLMMLPVPMTFAQPPEEIAEVSFTSDRIELYLIEPVINIAMTVSGPDNIYLKKQLDPEAPYIHFDELGKDLAYGLYKYEITAQVLSEKTGSDNSTPSPSLDNGRGLEGRDTPMDQEQTGTRSLYQDGWFRLEKQIETGKAAVKHSDRDKMEDEDE